MPEAAFTFEKLISDVKEVYKGIRQGVYHRRRRTQRRKRQIHYGGNRGRSARTAFGHVQLGGVADMLKDVIEKEAGIKARTGTN